MWGNTDQGRGFHQSFVFVTLLHQLDELDHIAGAGVAVAAEAAPGVRLRIDLQARRFVRVEGTQQPVVLVGL
jgi:hypothetical protein